jgi:two-component system, OmpR family, response regulator
MAVNERTYRLTRLGRDAWEREDLAVPADYRRMLWVMDFHGHAGVLRDLLQRYPRDVLDAWLAEMEELGLIEPVPEGEAAPGFDLRAADRTLALSATGVAQAAESASGALARTGAYVAANRIVGRPAVRKPVADCVVLIVEDDPDQLALADLRVSMAGYLVRVATSVNGFLHSILEQGAPDVLLLDVMLPDGDGFAVLARMRRHPVLGSLPIVMLTARNDPADIGKGLILGADAYVTKPYTKNILADVIRRVLGNDGADDARGRTPG